MKKLIAIVLLSGILMCVSGCDEELPNSSNTSTTTKSTTVSKSSALSTAEYELKYYYIQPKFNSLTSADVGSYTCDENSYCYNYKDERIDCFKFVIKGNASGYVDDYNDEYNKMTFTFTIYISKEDGESVDSDFDYDWKY